ncbi:MAG: dihydrolipoamide acetyltransferase family protein [Planctomycetota bacterium]
MYEFKLPDLGEGIHEGEILKWHVEQGGTITEDEPLVDVETDKAALTIPSPRSGKIVSLMGAVGDTVLVGDVITTIDDGNGAVAVAPSAAVAKAPPPAEPPAAVTPAEELAQEAAPAALWGRVVAAPATRRLAREMKIDIRQVPPTGPGGRVTPDDVKRFAEQGSVPTPAAETLTPKEREQRAEAEVAARAAGTIPFLDLEPLPDFSQWGPVEKEQLRSIRRKVARKMVTSMILVPHVAHMDDADVTLLEEFRKREKQRRGELPGGHLTLLSFVIKAVTAGLRAAPAFNASLDPFKEEIIYKKYYNIGIAVDTGRGLIVPVIRDTDRKSILRISAEIEEVAGKAREGNLEVADLRGGTFTITNVGPLGGTALIPTINYPEVAILGMGRVQEKPVVVDGQIVIRKILPLTLAFDHRIADGADAARFVSEMVRQLSDPNLLLLET